MSTSLRSLDLVQCDSLTVCDSVIDSASLSESQTVSACTATPVSAAIYSALINHRLSVRVLV